MELKELRLDFSLKYDHYVNHFQDAVFWRLQEMVISVFIIGIGPNIESTRSNLRGLSETVEFDCNRNQIWGRNAISKLWRINLNYSTRRTVGASTTKNRRKELSTGQASTCSHSWSGKSWHWNRQRSRWWINTKIYEKENLLQVLWSAAECIRHLLFCAEECEHSHEKHHLLRGILKWRVGMNVSLGRDLGFGVNLSLGRDLV